jgi:hypothetical protein
VLNAQVTQHGGSRERAVVDAARGGNAARTRSQN